MNLTITIYTKDNCPNCTTAKNLLKYKGLEYTELDAENPIAMANLLGRYPAIRQMPAIFINNQYVGGLAGLQSALKQVGI